MKYNPKIHHRQSIRLKGYDYSQPGAYFITICSSLHVEIFGNLIDTKLNPSPLGEIIRTEWFHSAEIRKEIRLFEDEFVLMPNHLHGILWIMENPLEADHVRSTFFNQNAAEKSTERFDTGDKDGHKASQLRVSKSVASFVSGFKASVTSRAKRELNLAAIWQRNYFEHVIRNQKEWETLHEYICTNPLRWLEDQLHSDAPANRFSQWV